MNVNEFVIATGGVPMPMPPACRPRSPDRRHRRHGSRPGRWNSGTRSIKQVKRKFLRTSKLFRTRFGTLWRSCNSRCGSGLFQLTFCGFCYIRTKRQLQSDRGRPQCGNIGYSKARTNSLVQGISQGIFEKFGSWDRKSSPRPGNFPPEKPEQGKAEGNCGRETAGRFGGARWSACAVTSATADENPSGKAARTRGR